MDCALDRDALSLLHSQEMVTNLSFVNISSFVFIMKRGEIAQRKVRFFYFRAAIPNSKAANKNSKAAQKNSMPWNFNGKPWSWSVKARQMKKMKALIQRYAAILRIYAVCGARKRIIMHAVAGVFSNEGKGKNSTRFSTLTTGCGARRFVHKKVKLNISGRSAWGRSAWGSRL